MHDSVGILGGYILISLAVAFLVSLVTGFRALKGGLVTSAILLAVSIALSFPPLHRLGVLIIELPVFIMFVTVGLFGALPGAAAGRWLRSKVVRKEV